MILKALSEMCFSHTFLLLTCWILAQKFIMIHGKYNHFVQWRTQDNLPVIKGYVHRTVAAIEQKLPKYIFWDPDCDYVE